MGWSGYAWWVPPVKQGSMMTFSPGIFPPNIHDFFLWWYPGEIPGRSAGLTFQVPMARINDGRCQYSSTDRLWLRAKCLVSLKPILYIAHRLLQMRISIWYSDDRLLLKILQRISTLLAKSNLSLPNKWQATLLIQMYAFIHLNALKLGWSKQ